MKIETIQKADKDKKAIFGKKAVLKAIKRGEIKTVALAKNTPLLLRDEIELLSKSIAGIKVENLDLNNDELGSRCKKPFSISVIGMKE